MRRRAAASLRAGTRGTASSMSRAHAKTPGAILVVNDADGARYVMTRMLERSGFTVLAASTGGEALQAVATGQPQLVVLDLQLPDIGGLELCRRLKADPATRHIKVLHTSAVYVATESKVESLESGADGYLSQPFEREELIATVRSLLRLTEVEEALRARADQLDEANRRTNEFLAMLAHELRNPLAALVAALPLVERRAPVDGAEGRAREVMRRQSAQLTRLVDDLLDVARVTQGKIHLKQHSVDLSALVARVAENARQSKTEPRGQTLEVAVPPGPLYARGDELRLEQVVANLLDNAAKYTDSGGSIRVEVTHEAASGSEGWARIAVRDSGMGIAPDSLHAIFDLFSQADVPLARSRGGLGVGLTLVRRLVELHGGHVHAESAGRGCGSTFTVHLPLTEQATAPGEAARPAAQAPHEGSRRILLVEDNEDAQTALTMLLELWGHDVVTAQDGLTGVAAAARERPDIALVDLGLPGVDGFEVARRIRATRAGRHMLLVALTGYGSPDDRDRALAAGFDVHLVKPVEPARLLALLSEAPPRECAGTDA